ncbi:MAG: hypothetical protein ABEN55_06220 [Bradymonadaceae bacterium]
MSLDSDRLKNSIVSKMKTKLSNFTDDPNSQKAIEAIAEGIVEEIVDNADVTVTGVTSGSSSASGSVS